MPIKNGKLFKWTKAQRSQWSTMKKGGEKHYMSIDRIKKLQAVGFDNESGEVGGT